MSAAGVGWEMRPELADRADPLPLAHEDPPPSSADPRPASEVFDESCYELTIPSQQALTPEELYRVDLGGAWPVQIRYASVEAWAKQTRCELSLLQSSLEEIVRRVLRAELGRARITPSSQTPGSHGIEASPPAAKEASPAAAKSALKGKAADFVPPAELTPDTVVHQRMGLLPRRVYLRMAREGAFPSWRLGKLVCARWGEVQAAIRSAESLGRAKRLRPKTDQDAELDLDELRRRSGLVPVGDK